ncbi:MAG TPA: hypothetical protein PKC24_11945 [Cyclobacteriaceae bacterium]|nr:hypothetical protein [Cyclobacteriaceae bacterium]
MKSLSIVLIVLLCIFFFWIPIAIGATVFGLVAGLLGAVFGLIGGIIGIIAGVIAGIIKFVVHLVTFPFHWDLFSGKTFLILAIIILVIAVAKSSQNAATRQ